MLEQKPYHIVLCDDHPMFRQALLSVLTEILPSFTSHQEGSIQGLSQYLNEVAVDFIFLDLSLPDGCSRDYLEQLQGKTKAQIVIVSSSDQSDLIFDCLQKGIAGFIPKTTPVEVLKSAIQLVLSGGTYLPTELLLGKERSPKPVRVEKSETSNLTSRQKQIANLMANGLTNHEIGNILGLSKNTIKTHLQTIYRVLDVTNRTEATMLWLQQAK